MQLRRYSMSATSHADDLLDGDDRAVGQFIEEAQKDFHDLATLTRSQLTENEVQHARQRGKILNRDAIRQIIELIPRATYVDTSKLDAYQKYLYYTTPSAKHKFLFRDRHQTEEKRGKKNMITPKRFQASSYKLLSGGAIHCNRNRNVIGGVKAQPSNDTLSDTVIRHHHFASSKKQTQQGGDGYQAPNAHMKEIFKRMRKLLEELWEEISIPQQTRSEFQQNYYFPETMENYSCIFAEISKLNKMRNQQHVVPKLIEKRECMLLRLQHLVPKFNPSAGDVKQKMLQNEIVNVILELRRITCQVVQGIVVWRQISDTPQPFIWHNVNYMLKMQNDLAFLQNTSFQRLLGINVEHNPFLLPDRKTANALHTAGSATTSTTTSRMGTPAVTRGGRAPPSTPQPLALSRASTRMSSMMMRPATHTAGMMSDRRNHNTSPHSHTSSPSHAYSYQSLKTQTGKDGKPILVLPPNTVLTSPGDEDHSVLDVKNVKNSKGQRLYKDVSKSSKSSTSKLPGLLKKGSGSPTNSSARSVEDTYKFPVEDPWSSSKKSSKPNPNQQELPRLKYRYPPEVLEQTATEKQQKATPPEVSCGNNIIHMLTPQAKKTIARGETGRYKRNPEEFFLTQAQLFQQKFNEKHVARGKLPPQLQRLMNGELSLLDSVAQQELQQDSLIVLSSEVSLPEIRQYEAIIQDEDQFLLKCKQQKQAALEASLKEAEAPTQMGKLGFQALEAKLKEAAALASNDGGLRHIGQELLHQINMQKMWQEHGVEIDFDTRDDDDESDWSSSEEGGEWGDTGAFNKTYDSALEIATGL